MFAPRPSAIRPGREFTSWDTLRFNIKMGLGLALAVADQRAKLELVVEVAKEVRG